VAVEIGNSVPTAVAATAIRNLGAMDIQVIDDRGVIGWLGREWAFRINLQTDKQGYEVGVATTETSGSLGEFVCCARPQLGMAIVGVNRSQELAVSVAAEMVRLASSGDSSR
jgi:hypothetical protein